MPILLFLLNDVCCVVKSCYYKVILCQSNISMFYMMCSCTNVHSSAQVRIIYLYAQQNCMFQHEFRAACAKLARPIPISRCCHLISQYSGNFTVSLVDLQLHYCHLPTELSLGLCIAVSRIHSLMYGPVRCNYHITQLCSSSSTCTHGFCHIPQRRFRGGSHTLSIHWPDIKPYVQSPSNVYDDSSVFTYIDYVQEMTAASFSMAEGFVTSSSIY